MVKDIIQSILDFLKSRIFILGIIVIGLFSILIYRVFHLQIVKQDYYLNNYIQKAEKEVKTSGTRGVIYDRNGVILADNKLAYAIEIEDSLEKSSDKNEKLNKIIDKTVKIIQSNGDSVLNDFPIIIDTNNNFQYSVTEDEKLKFLRDLYGKKSISELDDDKNTLSTSTPDDVMNYLCSERFDISDDYTNEEKINIAMIRYNMSLNSFQKYITTKIASNVSEETVAAIYESSAELEGVNVTQETMRVYNDSVYFSHLLGYTGKISEDQMAKFNEDGDNDYINSDIVGKSGIESRMESELQGTKGETKYIVDSTGKILETVSQTDAKAGNDVYLSIDARYQKAGYTILEHKLAGILCTKIVNGPVHNTEDSKVIYIPVKDVYFQLFNNNVVDINKFANEDASANEQRIYSKFQAKQQTVLNSVYSELVSDSAQPMNKLTDEYQKYMSYIYEKLSNESVLITNNIDSSDEKYVEWTNNTISLRDFLLYAISQNWIDSSKLFSASETKYSGSDEIYNKLVEYLDENLQTDTKFSKKIYYYLIDAGTVTGNEVCLTLYDQNVLEADEAQYQSLSAGASSYDFIMEQIRQIKITPAQLALDPCSGSLVVTDVNTGKVLALVTYPSYDNNMLSGTVDSVYWNKLNNDLSLPLYNRATQTRTAPGSTFKMVTAMAGLEEGKITPTQTITDLGQFTKITPSPKCWKYPGTHGSINVSQALEVSCNYFFYEVGYELSKDASGNYNSTLGLPILKKYADMLGLDELSGVEIDENEPKFAIDNMVRASIGQASHTFSGVQLARYVSTIANNGNNYQLSLLDKVVDSNGDSVETFEPILSNTIDVKQSTWDAIHKGMRLVAESGTARTTLSNFSISVAGKSGTAQENKLRSNHSLFVAYAPYEDPQYGISVSIPNGESTGYTAEVVRDILSYIYGLTTDEELYGGTASIPVTGVTSE